MSKVLLLNGSPHKEGCTFTALTEIAQTLEKKGVEAEINHLGVKPVPGCMACGACNKTGKCVQDDIVNIVAAKLDDADGIILGSPVYYAGPSGQMSSFADRLWRSSSKKMDGKLGACVASCRRGGASATFDRLNKYFTISNMHIVGSQYWNQVHGNTPEEVKQDLEGLQTMRTLGENMAWLLKCIEAGKAAGVAAPKREEAIKTNYINL